MRVSARSGRIIPFPQVYLNHWEDFTDVRKVKGNINFILTYMEILFGQITLATPVYIMIVSICLFVNICLTIKITLSGIHLEKNECF